MTSKLVVNTIESDTGISSVSFASSISMSSTSKFHFSDAGIDIGADTNINRPAAGVLGFNINGSEKVRINSSGRLGLGTDNPDTSLTIQSGGDAQMSLKNSSGTTKAYVGTAGAFGSASTDDLRIRSDSSNIVFGFSGAEKLRINSYGKVGLGTTGSDYGLSIREADNNNKFLMLQKSSGQELLQIREDGNNHVIIDGSHASGELHFYTAGNERVVITSGGHVNIGGDYTQTSRTLAVTGTALFKATEADIWMESTGPNGVWRILGSTGTNTHRFRIYDNTNNGDRFNIDSNGYIYEPEMPFGVLHGSTGWRYNNNGAGHYLLGNTDSSSGGGNGSDKQLNCGWTTSGANGATNNNFTPSNGIWTAPIAGYYVFGLKLYCLMNSNEYIQIKPCLNGTHLSETIYGFQQGNGIYCEGINETVRYYMGANDTFSWNAYGPNNAWRIYGTHSEISGYLVRGA